MRSLLWRLVAGMMIALTLLLGAGGVAAYLLIRGRLYLEFDHNAVGAGYAGQVTVISSTGGTAGTNTTLDLTADVTAASVTPPPGYSGISGTDGTNYIWFTNVPASGI